MRKIIFWKCSWLLPLGSIMVIGSALLLSGCWDKQAQWKNYFYVNKNVLVGLTDKGKKQTNLEIPQIVASIDHKVFDECSSLKTLVIPNTIVDIPANTFNNCSVLKNVTNNSTILFNWWVRHHDYQGLTLNQMTNIDLGKIHNSSGQLFTKINDDTFYGCASLTNIIIPNNIVSIGKNAFKNCPSTVKYQVFNQNNLQALIDSGIDEKQITLSEGNFIINASKLVGLTETGKKASTITIPKMINEIDSHAFNDCHSLKKVIISEDVKTIGENAFNSCSLLTNVTFFTDDLSFEKNAFDYNNQNIKFYTTSKIIYQNLINLGINYQQIIFSDGNFIIQDQILIGLTEIGKNQTNLKIPKEITQIGDHAFDGCWKLINVHLPKGLVSIGNYAFNECSSLTEIMIPNEVNKIGEYAFSKCSVLKNITFTSASKLVDIGNHAFNGCTSLTKMEIPFHVVTINRGTFKDCNGLKEIKFLGYLHSISIYAFDGTSPDTKYFVMNEGMRKSLKDIKIDDSRIFLIKSNFIFSGTSLVWLTDIGKHQKTLTIPGWVTNIGTHAFESCQNLESVIIPKSVISISSKAFQNCTDKVLYYITTDVVQKSLFASESNIHPKQIRNPYLIVDSSGTTITGISETGKDQKELLIPDSITSISSNAFLGCKTLEKITIPRSVNHIGKDIFCDSPLLKSEGVINNSQVLFNWWVDHHIYIDRTLNEMSYIDLSQFTNSEGKLFNVISDYAFSVCTGLIRIIINDEVSIIGHHAFSYCLLLEDVVLPKHLQILGEYAFENCSSLLEIEIPNQISKIANNTFASCFGLKKVIFIEDSKLITIDDNAFLSCIGLTEIKFPSSLETIGESAFSGCKSLQTVIIPNVSVIKKLAFHECGLTAKYYVANAYIQSLLINLLCGINENQIIVGKEPEK